MDAMPMQRRNSCHLSSCADLFVLQALTLADKNGIPRDTFLAFVDTFFPAKPIQVCRLVVWPLVPAGGVTPGGVVDRHFEQYNLVLHPPHVMLHALGPHVQGYARRAAEEQLDASQGITVDLALKDARWGAEDWREL